MEQNIRLLKSKYQCAGFQVLRITETPDAYDVVLRDKGINPVKCPVCGEENIRWNYTELRTYQDTPCDGKKVILHVSRRDIKCSCGKHFTAPNSLLPGKHFTSTVTDMIRVAKNFDGVSAKKIATVLGVSERTVRRVK